MEAVFGALIVGMLAEMRISMGKIGKRVDRLEIAQERQGTGKYLIHGLIPVLCSIITYATLH
jgi:hypothetical protein